VSSFRRDHRILARPAGDPALQRFPGDRCGHLSVTAGFLPTVSAVGNSGAALCTQFRKVIKVNVIEDPLVMPVTEPGLPSDDVFARCAMACNEAARLCKARVDSCLSGGNDIGGSGLTGCVDAAVECADICQTTAWAVIRHQDGNTALLRHLLRICVQACRVCRGTCPKHADGHQHCRASSRACLGCEESCQELLAALQGL